jgi:hypothetical protein
VRRVQRLGAEETQFHRGGSRRTKQNFEHGRSVND